MKTKAVSKPEPKLLPVGTVPTAAEAERVRAAIARCGNSRVKTALQLDRAALGQIAAGLPVRRGTMALLRLNFPALDALDVVA